MDWLKDTRTECWSVLLTITVREYLDLIKDAHEDRGGIAGQRDVLKTTTAKRIRERMISDIRLGAVLPPVVVGAVVDDATFQGYPRERATRVADVLPAAEMGNVAIIDGMQRTAALMEASRADPGILDKFIRVELWLARSVRPMVYRMLVLNTGQVPWNINRQLAVVYKPLLEEIREAVPAIDKIPSPDQPGRRVAPAQYAAEDVVELYLAFSLRKTALDTKEALSEEFSRLDFVENLSDERFQSQFYEALSLLADFDKTISRFEGPTSERFAKGRNVFDGQPARIGFIVAIGQHVLGRPGQDRSGEERQARIEKVKAESDELMGRLNAATPEQLGEFLRLDVLSEILDRRVGQVGRYERSVFFEAFRVLVDERFSVPNMEQCWRAN